ncbi:TonB-dependent receptor [Steroidobacter agaridevorans]|uniref:TonB-dependent receptor n=1 Tax=Steroidobacter agaridevorans TaxID=2695856 RepID=A0A829YI21_9GAMM|nr:TonB-dependent receptor [Steroidobacter agaridevorans]GFE82523.1 TonB-dependent receptor [Steroidobacter agaridevorans]
MRTKRVATALAGVALLTSTLAHAEEQFQLEEVIVTASKRAESSRDVAGAVAALGREQLEAINASNFQDFATYVPGVSSLGLGIGQNQVVVRGVTTGAQSSSTVALLVDEIPIGSSSAFAQGAYALDYNAFDLQRIELLSGPQGTLYGASAMGGLLKYVTQAPDLGIFEERLQAEVSSSRHGRSNYAGRMAINAPVIRDQLGVRAVAYLEDSGGVIDDPARGRNDVDSAKAVGGRFSVLGKLGEHADIRLSATYQDIERDGSTLVDRYVTGQPVRGEYEQSVLLDEPLEQNIQLYSAVINWDLSWATLTSATGWQELELSTDADNTALYGALFRTGTAVPFNTPVSNRTEKFTQELRLASPTGGSFEWLVGAFYADEDSRNETQLRNWLDPDGNLGGVPLFKGVIPTKYEEIAVFGTGAVHFSERFDVALGVRYSEDRQDYRQLFQGVVSNPLNPFAITESGATSKESVTTYLFSPRFRLSEGVLLYGRVASGYRPGGPNFVTVNSSGQPIGNPTFDPDSLWNYEVGTKTTFLNGRATLDASVYLIDWSDIQLTVNRGGVNQLENGGEAQVKGVELSGRYMPISGLTLGGSATYTDAQLTQDSPALGARDGQRLPLSPRFSSALTADYLFPVGQRAEGLMGVSYRYLGERTSGFDGSPVRPQYDLDAFSLVDLRVGVRLEAFDVRLFVDNVFDELGEVSALSTARTVNPAAPVRVSIAQPRTIGLSITMNFSH